ncbi:MAG: stage sporulation protein [Bacillota bacterium]|jgi:stage V sporulation protein AC
MEKYSDRAKRYHPKIPIFVNISKAFIAGGTVCALGEILQQVYRLIGTPEEHVGNLMVATLVFLSCLLTGLGLYDKFGQWGGAGSAVPVTGFANAMASAALEHRSEGYVLGVGGNMFKLAGSVVVFGAVSAFVVTLVRILIFQLGWCNCG